MSAALLTNESMTSDVWHTRCTRECALRREAADSDAHTSTGAGSSHAPLSSDTSSHSSDTTLLDRRDPVIRMEGGFGRDEKAHEAALHRTRRDRECE